MQPARRVGMPFARPVVLGESDRIGQFVRRPFERRRQAELAKRRSQSAMDRSDRRTGDREERFSLILADWTIPRGAP